MREYKPDAAVSHHDKNIRAMRFPDIKSLEEIVSQGLAQQQVVMAPSGLFDRLAITQQRKLLQAFHEFSQPGGSVLEVGCASSEGKTNVPSFIALADNSVLSGMTSHTIQAFGSAGKTAQKNRRFRLPFADREFDWVCSSGVIEHMGNPGRQFEFIRETTRVAKKGVFVATPNRRHPINFSTAGRSQLLQAKDLYRMAAALPGKLEHDVGHKRVFGIKAHFFLMITKKQASR